MQGATERFASADPNARLAAAVLRTLFGEAYARDFNIALWEGTFVPATRQARFTLRINSPGALRSAFTPPVDLNSGRTFAAGLLDVDGDIEAAVDELHDFVDRPPRLMLLKLALLLRKMPRAKLPELREARLHGKRHSLARDRAAIGFHYDQPVEFYSSFLDRDLVYSCAYFDDGVTDLDAAQHAKIDHTLRKVRLAPGERLLDIGCGWGALVIRAAQEFGAQALGVTLSERQAREANRRIAQAGLQERARVELLDYRELPREGLFDKIVSIGMFEHVGRDKLPEYFETAYRLLKPGSLFLNHGIALQKENARTGKSTGFMGHLIFPDGELVSISDSLQFAERAGFEVRDVENLREHYARTLRHWVKNLEKNRAQAVAAAGQQSFSAWRLYLAGSAQGFRSGRIGVYQSLLAKPSAAGAVSLPATRRDLYSAGTSRAG